jgi:hypothetical protein
MDTSQPNLRGLAALITAGGGAVLNRFVLVVVRVAVLSLPTLVSAQSVVPVQQADLRCVGVFTTPWQNTGNISVNYPMDLKGEIDGRPNYIQLTGDGYVGEFVEPETLAPCDTVDLSTAPQATFGKVWGKIPPIGRKNGTLLDGFANYYSGIKYDAPTGMAIVNGTGTYLSNGPGVNSFAFLKFNPDSTLSFYGCYALSATTHQAMASASTVDIPAWFLKAYGLPDTHRFGISGSYAGATAGGGSLGPAIAAISLPPPNDCAPGKDYPLDGGIVLSRFPAVPGTPANPGPSCKAPDFGGHGCDVTNTPIPPGPIPARTAHTEYSYYEYTSDWEVKDGKGFWGSWIGGLQAWYDDTAVGGNRSSLMSFMFRTQGWVNQRVKANPAPGVGFFYIDSVSTHDGSTIRPKDVGWAVTCRVGASPGCTTKVNNRHMSFIEVTKVDPATGRVDFTYQSTDEGTGDHAPVAGEKVHFGVVYAWGMPRASRMSLGRAIWNVPQMGEIAQGKRQPYQLDYLSDVPLNFPGIGCHLPSCVKPGVDIRSFPAALIPDPKRRRLLHVVNYGKRQGGVSAHAVYVYQVGDAAPRPPAPTNVRLRRGP